MHVVGIVAADETFAQLVADRLLEHAPDCAIPILDPERLDAAAFGVNVPLVVIWSECFSPSAIDRVGELLAARRGRTPGVLINADIAPPPAHLVELASHVIPPSDIATLSSLFAQDKASGPATPPPRQAGASGRGKPALSGVFGVLTLGALGVGLGTQSLRHADAEAIPQAPTAASEQRVATQLFAESMVRSEAVRQAPAPGGSIAAEQPAMAGVAAGQVVAPEPSLMAAKASEPLRATLRVRQVQIATLEVDSTVRPLAVFPLVSLDVGPLEPLAPLAEPRQSELAELRTPLVDELRLASLTLPVRLPTMADIAPFDEATLRGGAVQLAAFNDSADLR